MSTTPFDPVSRRSFLRTTAVAAGAAATLSRFPLRAADLSGARPDDVLRPAPSWIDKPMRWAQLTLVEDDPEAGKFDLQFWLDYFSRTHSDAVCLSGGGCVAYYPTEIPFHHRSAWLGDRDILGELIAGCRERDMVVIVRTDPHATYDDVRAAHPDWIAVTADGQPRRHWASPEMWVTCGLGPYNFEFMTEVKKEIVSRYQVDGVFINRWDGSGLCHCQHCQANFKAATGYDLPATDGSRDAVGRAYLLWRQQRLFDLWQVWDAEVRRINPDACVIPNVTGGASSRLDMQRMGHLTPMLMADRQARHGPMAPWAIGMSAKEYRAAMGMKPVIGIFSVGIEEAYRWKDSVQAPDEIRLWVADLLANGMRPWFTKFAGAINDPRWLKPVEEIYTWCHEHESYLRNTRPRARVAMVYSQQTAWFADTPRDRIEGPRQGWYQALVESRVPFEMVHEQLLDLTHLEAFKTLILPNLIALSDEQCNQLRAFVRAGGSIIATSETSLADETGAPRRDFGLADLFGVSFVDRRPGPVRNSYLRLEHDTTPGHPLLRGLEDAPRIIHGVWQLEVAPTTSFDRPPVTLVPSYPDLPMEKVFSRTPRTNIPQVFLREFGAGRVAYFPWDIDRTFNEVQAVDHLMLMRNAVEWATNEDALVTVDGPGVFDVTVWEQENSMTVHLVNLTNPMMLQGPVRALIPVGPERVRVRLPRALRGSNSVRFLVAGRPADYQSQGDTLEVMVPFVTAHEVIAIDLG